MHFLLSHLTNIMERRLNHDDESHSHFKCKSVVSLGCTASYPGSNCTLDVIDFISERAALSLPYCNIALEVIEYVHSTSHRRRAGERNYTSYENDCGGGPMNF